jgi:G3E family GTPase
MKNRGRLTAAGTNLITGFLGSGKTTSILHLLAQKPADEKWAVLVFCASR